MLFLEKNIIRTPLFSLSKTFDENIFNEAIYITSPDLYKEYKKLLAVTLTNEQEIKKLRISLFKYTSRASTRCTPFGLFAGLCLGTFGNENSVSLNSDLIKTLERHTRLDMNVLCSLIKVVENKEFIKPYLIFYQNNSLYKFGSYYRYVEYYFQNRTRIV